MLQCLAMAQQQSDTSDMISPSGTEFRDNFPTMESRRAQRCRGGKLFYICALSKKRKGRKMLLRANSSVSTKVRWPVVAPLRGNRRPARLEYSEEVFHFIPPRSRHWNRPHCNSLCENIASQSSFRLVAG